MALTFTIWQVSGKYINVKPDYYDPIKEKVDAYWYGDLDTILDDDQK